MARSRDWQALGAATGSTTEPNELSDEQWSLIADLFPEPKQSPQGGRPPAPARACFNGVCWVLHTGARWQDMPKHFPSGSTCWRRHQKWTSNGTWEKAWSRLLHRLDRAGVLDTTESMGDGTFCSAKKGANASARRSAAKALSFSSWSIITVCLGAPTLPVPALTK